MLINVLKSFTFSAFIIFVGLANAEELSPTVIDGATTVDTAQAFALFDKEVAFVDVRKNSDWEAGRVASAIHIELKKVYSKEALLAEVKIDEPFVVYCNGPQCLRSSVAAKKAVEWGFSKVYYYRDGFPAWKANSNPVE